MLIDRFGNIVSAILSLTGVMFVLKGILRLSPDLIAKISQTHLDFNLMQIQNLASQKADFVFWRWPCFGRFSPTNGRRCFCPRAICDL
jgi:hypothetical protein